MPDIDNTNPLDNAIVSQFPANERASRTATENIIDTEHSGAGGTASGRHKFGVGNDAARDAITDWEVGSIWFNTSSSPALLQRVVSTGPVVWENIAGPYTTIPQSTRAVFYQAAAPTGWTQVVTENDKVLKVTSGSGGGSGGSWTITGLSNAAVALSIAQMPAHNHTYGSGTAGTNFSAPIIGGNLANNAFNGALTTSVMGSGATHNHTPSHDGSWRPAHINVIVCSLD